MQQLIYGQCRVINVSRTDWSGSGWVSDYTKYTRTKVYLIKRWPVYQNKNIWNSFCATKFCKSLCIAKYCFGMLNDCRSFWFNLLWSSDAIFWHQSGSILSQVMAWCRQAPHYSVYVHLIFFGCNKCRHFTDRIYQFSAENIELFWFRFHWLFPKGPIGNRIFKQANNIIS